MSRTKYLIGNWKMNHTITESKEFCYNLPAIINLADRKNVKIGVCPSFLSLNTVRRNTPFSFIVASQDVHYEQKGAFTGNVSIPMLKEIGITYSLVGHSERRQYQHETNEICNKKIKALVENNFKVIYCVGETLSEYENELTQTVVEQQIREGLLEIQAKDMSKIIIAYEPVWSIGTGINASAEIAESVCAFIRKTISELYSEEIAEQTSIIYGGSVNSDNIHSYMTTDNVDGALVGGASLNIVSYKKLVENF